jgi:RNA polymerase sigma factor (sigma-70 family)
MPFQLKLLLDAAEESVREAAWERLIAEHTRLLLAIARSFGGGADATMDRYAYVLEKLREGNFHRLRTFDENKGARFSTWLTLASRRLCVDYERRRYGRRRDARGDEDERNRLQRRQLIDCLGEELQVETLIDEAAHAQDRDLILAERLAALRSSLQELTSRERLILALRFEDGHSASSIAGMIGSPSAFHVYRQLNAILASLRERLATKGVDGIDD